MRRRITDTTFGKMTVAYLLFGVIPLFLISLLFFSRFTDNIRETMIRNYAQINGYFARNVQDIMESADAAMAELYNYETDDGESLAAVLKNSNLTDGERSLEVDEALKEVMSKSKHILDDFAQMLGDIAVIEKPAKMEGRSMSMVLTEKR